MFSITKKIKMKKIYCLIFDKYRKFQNSKIYIYILEKTLVLCIIFNKFENEDEKILKEEESIEIVKMNDLKI